MRRIISACVEQTMHFRLKDRTEPKLAAKLTGEEFEAYKMKLDRDMVQYSVLDEQRQSDGSLIIKIKRQYNNYPCGEYIK